MTKILHIDPFHGASGDMFLGAFLDLGVDAAQVREMLLSLELPAWDWQIGRVDRGGLDCCRVQFVIPKSNNQVHRHLPDVIQLLARSKIPAEALDLAQKAFTTLAKAEGRVHGCSPDEVAFHELGAMDSILDITAACICFHLLSHPYCTCGLISLGHGEIETAHGRYPVPPPAVLEILRGVPVTGGENPHELTTPTGAALIVTFAEEFTSLPRLCPSQVGMGAGQRDWEGEVNALRLILGVGMEEKQGDDLVEISCNLDDMPPIAVPPVINALLRAGAVDVWTVPAQMKKGRPGLILSALVAGSFARDVAETMLANTTTLGVRFSNVHRIVLDRDEVIFATPWGDCRAKIGYLTGEVKQIQPEFEDVLTLAEKAGLPFLEVYTRCLVMARQALGPDNEEN